MRAGILQIGGIAQPVSRRGSPVRAGRSQAGSTESLPAHAYQFLEVATSFFDGHGFGISETGK